uniref:Uncharacterized protein n=1 Tax=Nothoprocta perdicaria TaxID=30464 RepID=A0A8C6Z1I4_NOTPE
MTPSGKQAEVTFSVLCRYLKIIFSLCFLSRGAGTSPLQCQEGIGWNLAPLLSSPAHSSSLYIMYIALTSLKWCFILRTIYKRSRSLFLLKICLYRFFLEYVFYKNHTLIYISATYKNYSTVIYVHIYRYILSACPCCVLFPSQSKGIVAAAPRRFLSRHLVETTLLLIAEWGAESPSAGDTHPESAVLGRTSAHGCEVLLHAALPGTSLLAALCKTILLSSTDQARFKGKLLIQVCMKIKC